MKIATRIALLYSLLLAPAALGGVIPRSSASDISFIRRASGDESETQRDAGQSRSLGEDGAEGQQESTKSDGGLIKRMAEEPEESDEASTAQELPTTSPSGLQNNLDVPLAPTTMAGGASKINVLPTTVEDGTMSMLPVPTLGAGSGVSAGVGSGAADSAAVSQLTMSDAVSSKTATSTGLSQVIGPAIATNAASGKSNDLNEPPPPLPDPPRRGEPPVPNAPAGLGGTQPAIPHAPSQSAVPVPTASQGGLPSSAVSPATPSSGSGHTTPSSGGSSSGNGSGSGSGSGASSGSPSTCSTTSKPLQAVQCLLDASPTCPLPGGGCGVLVELKPYIKTDIDACKDFVTLAAQVCAQCSGTEEMYDLYNAYLTRCGAAGDGGAGAVNNAESAEGEEQKGTGTPTATTGGVQTADEVQSGAASSESAGDASSAAGQGTESESGSTPTDIATESGSANAVATSATSYTRTGSGAGSNASVTFTETSELSAKPTGGASSDDNQSASTTPGKVDANGDRWYDAGVRTGQAADGRGTSTPAQSGSASDVGDEGGKGPSSDSGAASVDSDATETEVTGAGASDATGTASKASATASAGGSDGVEPDATAPRQEGAASRPPDSMSMNASEQADGGAEGSDTKPRPSDSPSSANGVLADGSTDVPKNGTATGTDDLSVKSKSSATATSQGSKGTAETELQSPAMSETKRFFENEIDEACLDTGCQAWADAYKECKGAVDSTKCMCTDNNVSSAGECSSCMGKAGRSSGQAYSKQMKAYAAFKLSCPATKNSGGTGGGQSGNDVNAIEDVAEPTPSDSSLEAEVTAKPSKGKKLIDEGDATDDGADTAKSASEPDSSGSGSTGGSAKSVQPEHAASEAPEVAPKPDSAFRRADAGWWSVVLMTVGTILLSGWVL